MVLFEEVLIEEVRKHVHLYDIKSNYHRDKNFVEETWVQIAEKLNSTADACRKKWSTLRGSYTREIKLKRRRMGFAAFKKRKWIFFESMSFLDPYLVKRSTYSEKTPSVFIKSELALRGDQHHQNQRSIFDSLPSSSGDLLGGLEEQENSHDGAKEDWDVGNNEDHLQDHNETFQFQDHHSGTQNRQRFNTGGIAMGATSTTPAEQMEVREVLLISDHDDSNEKDGVAIVSVSGATAGFSTAMRPDLVPACSIGGSCSGVRLSGGLVPAMTAASGACRRSLQVTPPSLPQLADEDEAYGSYITAELRKMTPIKKSLFRMKIQQVLHEMNFGAVSSFMPLQRM